MATLQLEFSAPHATRAAAAFGIVMGTMTDEVLDAETGEVITPSVPRPATMEEVRSHTRQYIVNVVKATERRIAESAVVVDEIDPT